MVIQNKFSDRIVPPIYNALTLYPFIFVRTDVEKDFCLIPHEKIHLEQQKELLVIPFYIIYVLHWLINVITFCKYPYHNIAFEQEAYNNDWNPNYLSARKRYNWVKYLFKRTIKDIGDGISSY